MFITFYDSFKNFKCLIYSNNFLCWPPLLLSQPTKGKKYFLPILILFDSPSKEGPGDTSQALFQSGKTRKLELVIWRRRRNRSNLTLKAKKAITDIVARFSCQMLPAGYQLYDDVVAAAAAPTLFVRFTHSMYSYILEWKKANVKI